MRLALSAAAALAFCTSVPAIAVPADAVSAVASPDRTDDMRKLDASRKPAEILQFMGLKRGDRALDLFGSGGYYGLIMARAVGPQGAVDAWEAANFVSPRTRKVWADIEKAIPNLRLISSPASDIQLPDNSYDFVMFNLNYHDLYWESAKYKFPRMDPRPFLEEVYRSMKPGAVLAVIDHIAKPGGRTRDIAQQLHRIDPATVRHDFEAAGFVLEAESSLLRNPGDRHDKDVFDPAVRFRTDQMIFRFRKPG